MIQPDFSPTSALLGGAMIGTASALTWWLVDKVPGVSGIVGRILQARAGDTAWRALFVVGLLGGAALAFWLRPATARFTAAPSLGVAVAAGLLVGFGSRLGGGCTSGHGVCGIGRGSGRSIVATLVFMLAGFATVLVARHLLGGAA
ncbi:MAG: YeeE/YedE family protein [Planctomycetes bacterium]|nr:YeeE/YedE family protein [Planctomycetota bacterium]